MTFYTRTITEECEARQWIVELGLPGGMNDAAERVVAWANDHGGEARYEPEYRNLEATLLWGSRIAVRTKDGWAYAKPGDYIVMGKNFESRVETTGGTKPCMVREFTVCDPETFQADRWTVKP